MFFGCVLWCFIGVLWRFMVFYVRSLGFGKRSDLWAGGNAESGGTSHSELHHQAITGMEKHGWFLKSRLGFRDLNSIDATDVYGVSWFVDCLVALATSTSFLWW